MKNFINFLTTEISKKENITGGIKGMWILILLFFFISIILLLSTKVSIGLLLLLVFSPLLLYVAIVFWLLLNFFLMGLIQYLYKKVYDIFRKIFRKK